MAAKAERGSHYGCDVALDKRPGLLSPLVPFLVPSPALDFGIDLELPPFALVLGLLKLNGTTLLQLSPSPGKGTIEVVWSDLPAVVHSINEGS